MEHDLINRVVERERRQWHFKILDSVEQIPRKTILRAEIGERTENLIERVR